MSIADSMTGPVVTGRVSLPNNVISRSFVAETVLMDVNSGRYFKLDRTAGVMLEALLAQRTVPGAALALSERGWGSEDVLRGDLSALTLELSAMGLLRLEEV